MHVCQSIPIQLVNNNVTSVINFLPPNFVGCLAWHGHFLIALSSAALHSGALLVGRHGIDRATLPLPNSSLTPVKEFNIQTHNSRATDVIHVSNPAYILPLPNTYVLLIIPQPWSASTQDFFWPPHHVYNNAINKIHAYPLSAHAYAGNQFHATS